MSLREKNRTLIQGLRFLRKTPLRCINHKKSMDDPLQLLNIEMAKCMSCELKNSRTQVVPGDYGLKRGICFIGEGPGKEEDLQGRPFVGRSGKLLDLMLQRIGISREEVSVLNIVKCRPPNNRAPLPLEMQVCGSSWLNRQLEILKPSIIVTLGSIPLRYFFPSKRISMVKGELLFLENGTPLFPLFHPAYILRNGSLAQEEYEKDFHKLSMVLSVLKKDTAPTKSANKEKQTSLLDFIP